MQKIIERSKGTVRFAFKESLEKLRKKPNQESLIMLHFSFGDVRFKYSTSYHSCYQNWDSKKQRIRNKSNIINRYEINRCLDQLEKEIKLEISRLDAFQTPITKKGLKAHLDNVTNKDYHLIEEEIQVGFYDFCNTFFKRKEGKVADTTLRSYKQTVKLMIKYDSYVGGVTNFEDINLDFYYNFISFLEDDDKALNTIGKHIKNLKTILNSSVDSGVNKYLFFKSKEFKVFTEESISIYLSEDEIEKLAKLDLSYNIELQKSRDIFLIGCYTGQRVSDYNGLDVKDIYTNGGYEFVKVKQQKSGNKVDCPITIDIQNIIACYDGNFPSRKAHQSINKDIKLIAARAKIMDEIKIVQTKGGQKQTSWLPKYKMVGTHTARRSFCTNMYKKGISVDYIMHFSGHKTVREFYKYIRVREEEKSLHIAKTGMFNLARKTG